METGKTDAKSAYRNMAGGRGKSYATTIAKLAIILIVLISPIMVAQSAFATVSQPDSSPTLSQIHVNRNLVSDNDSLYYFVYNLPYAAWSSNNVTADQAFCFKLMNGSTELGIMTPFVHFDKGYNYGIAALYFPASANLTWGTQYTIRISENPAQFTAPVDFNTTIQTSAYSSENTTAANQVELAANLYDMGQTLQSAYNKILFQIVGSQVVLADEGETYFRGAIKGLQAMAPSLFLIQQIPVNTEPADWTIEQFDQYAHRFDDVWVGASENATAEQIGAPTSDLAMALIIILPLSILAIIFSAMKFRRAEPGYITAAVFLIMGILMGWMPAAIFASLYQGAAIYTAYLIFYARG